MDEQQDPNPPLRLKPVYSTASVNASVTLYEGDLVLTQDSKTLIGSGLVELDWLPRPKLRFDFHPDPEMGQRVELKTASLSMPDTGRQAVVTINKVGLTSVPNPNASTISGVVDTFEVGNDSELNSIAFHIANFRNFAGRPVMHLDGTLSTSRAVMEADGWFVTIDSLHDDAMFAELETSGGFAITHVGRLERMGGQRFNAQESEPLFEALFRYLSFCRGCWVAPILTVGFDSNERRVWELWRDWKIERWREVDSWHNDFSVDGLERGFSGFYKRWMDEDWKEALLLALHWYVEANMCAGGVEGAVVLAQTSFELLAWTLLVEERRVLSEESFQPGKLPAMDKLRLLISACGIPLDIPSSLTQLVAFGKANGCSDGPQTLTQVRNTLVHSNPKKRRKLFDADSQVREEASDLSLWYLELIFLYLFGYRGEYSNRLRSGCWKGEEVETVPWAST